MDVTPYVEHDEPDFNEPWVVNCPRPTKRVKQPVQFEGNERGVESLIKAPQLVKTELHLNIDEVQLMYAALLEYKKNLRKTLADAKPPHALEDETFCYEQLGKIARMQFDLLDNHVSELERKFMHRYVDMD